MKKEFILSFILLFGLFINCTNKPGENSDKNIAQINIDYKDLKKTIDASSIFDISKFEFINLETNDSCLIGEITKIVLRDNKIIIYDALVKQVLLFNMDGSFYSRIYAMGNGPKEYPPIINDCVISENYVGMFTPVIGKIMLYDFKGNFVKDISLKGAWGITYFTFDENEFYIQNDWSQSENGYYHLFSLKDNKTEKLMPFKPISDVSRGWSLDNYYSLYDNHALMLYSSIDTIFEFSNRTKNVKPLYEINFENTQLSKEILTGDGRNAIEMSIMENKATGINNIGESSRYIILYTSDNKYIFFNKKTRKIDYFTESLTIPSWGNFNFGLSTSYIQDNKIITCFEPSFVLSVMKDWIDQTSFKNKEFENKINSATKKIKEETDNHIILITYLK